LLDRIDTLIAATASINPPALLADSRTDFLAVTAAFCCCFGFSALVLPFYRELQYREASDGSDTSEPLLALRMQAHGLAVLGARNLARGIRYLPKIHYAPAQWATIRQWAEFAAEEADMETAPLSPEVAYDLETCVFPLYFDPQVRLIFWVPQIGGRVEAVGIFSARCMHSGDGCAD
jgi:hypothetical protein